MLQIIKGPYLQWPTQNSITIMWETSSEASSKVDLCETEKVHSGLRGGFQTLIETKRTIEDRTCKKIHSVPLTGLKADTTYHYRIGSQDHQGRSVESDFHPLKTAVSQNTPFSFAVTSETGGYGDSTINEAIFSQIKRRRPEFLLLVGDSVGDGRVYEHWHDTLFSPGKELFVSTPFYLCLGNHEHCSPWFYKFVSYPEPKNYYSFDYGNAHFVSLDCTSEEDNKDRKPVPTEPGNGFMPGSPQYSFLVNSLKSSRATWKFVFFHYPPYVSGDYQVDQMRVLGPVFEEYSVDIVFNSHTIVYERSHPLTDNQIDMKNGVVYIVVGGAGAKPDWFHHKRAWHTAQALAVPHFVQVVIAQEMLELHAIDHEGRLFDMMKKSKTGNC